MITRLNAVLLVVGSGPCDLNTPPREWQSGDPVWTSPDGLAPSLCLHNHSYDAWYWHQGTQTLLRIGRPELHVWRPFELDLRWSDTAGAVRHGPLTDVGTFDAPLSEGET